MACTRTYRDFAGIDVSSEPSEVHDRRFAYAMNVWKDYHNENGEAVETAPGFTKVRSFTKGKVNSLHYFPGETPCLLVHYGKIMFAYWIMKNGDIYPIQEGGYDLGEDWSDARSTSVFHYGKLYIVDGIHYRVVSVKDFTNHESVGDNLPILSVTDVYAAPYIPTTFLEGEAYEQRNMLTPNFRQKNTGYGTGEDIDDFYIHDPCTKITDAKLNGVSKYLFEFAKPIDFFQEEGATFRDFKLFDSEGQEKILIKEETAPYWGIEFNDFEKVSAGDLTHPFPYASMRAGTLSCIKDAGTTLQEDVSVSVKYLEFGGGLGNNEVKAVLVNDVCRKSDEVGIFANVDPKTGYISSISWYKSPEKGSSVEVIIEGAADPAKFTAVGDMKDMLSGNPDFGRDTTALSAINGCTIIEEFDGRLFLSGNPKLPNSVFYTHRRHDTGLNDPSYIGAYNYLNDGTGSTPITAMISTPTYLVVLKDDVAQGSSAYYHTGQYNPSDDEITANLQPRVYPCEQGVPNVGCVGCATNFLDDPVFLSSRGLEAVGKSQVNLERSLAHRSYLVDAELINEDLRNARFAEWDGYLCILVPGGRMYLADSRQIDSTIHGHRQYEWYKWDGVGIHTTKTKRWRYDNAPVSEGAEYEGNAIVFDGSGGYTNSVPTEITIGDTKIMAVKETRGDDPTEYWFPVSWHGEYTGTDFKQATALLSLDGRLYFGCEDGSICMFLTQERDDRHRLLPQAYIRERGTAAENGTIYTGLGYKALMATKSDHCGRTNVAKSTEKGTFIIKAKAYPTSRLTVKVKADNGEWTTYYDNSVSRVDMSNFDFASVSFNTSDSFLIAIRERKRKWVEKQIHIEGWCFKSPFGLISATYDFSVAGKVKLR